MPSSPSSKNRHRPSIISITGTNGKTTITRLIGHMLAETGRCVGMTTTEGIMIAGKTIRKGDLTGPCSARIVLRHAEVEVAVLETARGGIVRAGLGYEHSDLSVLTNIHPDHLGQDGIEGIPDLIRIKKKVTEGVRPGGTLILNADDEHHSEFHRDDVCMRFFSIEKPAHVWLRQNWLVETAGPSTTPLLPIAEIPGSFDGKSLTQVANTAAALAAVRAWGLAPVAACAALRTYRPEIQNPGRGNLFRVPKGHLLLDYGHNPEALRRLGELIRCWPARQVTCVLGLPGDRKDTLLEESARMVASFSDRVVLREDRDLRGRQPGEMIALLRRELLHHIPTEKIDAIPDGEEALRALVPKMGTDDLIIYLYEDWETLERLLPELRAEPARGEYVLHPEES